MESIHRRCIFAGKHITTKSQDEVTNCATAMEYETEITKQQKLGL